MCEIVKALKETEDFLKKAKFGKVTIEKKGNGDILLVETETKLFKNIEKNKTK